MRRGRVQGRWFLQIQAQNSNGSKKTCAQLKWTNAARYGSRAVCGERDGRTKTGKCSGAVDFATAKAHCEHTGARLCTFAEVDADEAKNTGCNYDDKRVWSSTSCGTGKVWTQAGNTGLVGKAKKECTAVKRDPGAAQVAPCLEFPQSECPVRRGTAAVR